MLAHKRKLWLIRFALLLLMLALFFQIPVLPAAGAQVEAAQVEGAQAKGVQVEGAQVKGVQSMGPLRFPDVSDKAWYAADLRFITNDARRILEGSTDGRFYPDNKLSVEQFLKCVVVAANQRPAVAGGHWAQPFIEKAKEMGIIESKQFASYQAEITRGEMAVVIASAFVPMTGETKPSVDRTAVSQRMKDYNIIPDNQREAVCMAYSIGILTGMPDGKFHPEGILSRAEAVAVIRRVIDPSARIKGTMEPVDPVDPLDSGSSGDSGTSEVWSDEAFQEFMSTEEWKKYLNPNTIVGMEDGVLLFYDFEYEDSEPLLDAKRVPYKLEEPLYSKYYEITKTLGYYAKKLNGMAMVSYTELLGGGIEFDMSDTGGWIGAAPDLCFSIRHNKTSSFAPDFTQYFPEATDQDISIIWEVESFHSVQEFNQAFLDSKLVNFDYSQERYVEVFRRVVDLMLEKSVSCLFSTHVISQYDKLATTSRATMVSEHFLLADRLKVFSLFPRYTGLDTYFTNEGD